MVETSGFATALAEDLRGVMPSASLHPCAGGSVSHTFNPHTFARPARWVAFARFELLRAIESALHDQSQDACRRHPYSL